MLLFSREVHLHQNQDRKPIHTVSITTDTGKTVAQPTQALYPSLQRQTTLGIGGLL